MKREIPFPLDALLVVPVATARSTENRGTRCCVVRSTGWLGALTEKFESEKGSFGDALTSDGAATCDGATGCGCATTGAGAAINDAAATAAENCGVTRSRDCVTRRIFGRSGS